MTHALTHTGQQHERKASRWMKGLAAGATAAAINALIFMIGRAADLIPESVAVATPVGEGPLTIGPVLLMSILPALLAVPVYLVIGRLSSRPVRVFRIVAGVLLLFSLLMPFGIPGVPMKMALTLDLMHLVAGAAILVFVPFTDEPR